MARLYIFDLDGTISDPSQRAHLYPRAETDSDEGDEATWEEYGMAAGGDDLIKPVAMLMNTLHYAYDTQVWIVSGRTSLAHQVTVDWLARNDVKHDGLFLRPIGDHRPNVPYKLAFLDSIVEGNEGHEVVLWVDDYPAVIEAMTARGIPTLLYHPGKVVVH